MRSDFKRPFASILPRAFALATLAVSATSFADDGVFVYGALDAGVRKASGEPARGFGGGLDASRLGLRGSEDIGGGLSAAFQLEAGLDAARGSAPDSGAWLNRASHVGLRSGSHALRMGRQYNEAHLSLAGLDPLGFRAPRLNPNFQAAALADSGALGLSGPGASDPRTRPAASYEGRFGPFLAGAQYGAEDAPGARSFGARAGYDLGSVSLGASASRLADIQGSRLDAYTVGAKWTPVDHLSLAATYAAQASRGDAPAFGRRVGSLGAFYAPNDFAYGVAYYGTRQERQGAAGSQDKLVGLTSYSLSRRARLYGAVDYAHSAGSLLAPAALTPNALGAAVGLNYEF